MMAIKLEVIKLYIVSLESQVLIGYDEATMDVVALRLGSCYADIIETMFT